MEKILERICVVIQVAGYGLVVYFLWIIFVIDEYLSFTHSNVSFFSVMGGLIFVPLLIRWILTGKFQFKPVVSKED